MWTKPLRKFVFNELLKVSSKRTEVSRYNLLQWRSLCSILPGSKRGSTPQNHVLNLNLVYSNLQECFFLTLVQIKGYLLSIKLCCRHVFVHHFHHSASLQSSSQQQDTWPEAQVSSHFVVAGEKWNWAFIYFLPFTKSQKRERKMRT